MTADDLKAFADNNAKKPLGRVIAPIYEGMAERGLNVDTELYRALVSLPILRPPSTQGDFMDRYALYQGHGAFHFQVLAHILGSDPDLPVALAIAQLEDAIRDGRSPTGLYGFSKHYGSSNDRQRYWYYPHSNEPGCLRVTPAGKCLTRNCSDKFTAAGLTWCRHNLEVFIRLGFRVPLYPELSEYLAIVGFA